MLIIEFKIKGKIPRKSAINAFKLFMANLRTCRNKINKINVLDPNLPSKYLRILG